MEALRRLADDGWHKGHAAQVGSVARTQSDRTKTNAQCP